jgi:hypothetical protein
MTSRRLKSEIQKIKKIAGKIICGSRELAAMAHCILQRRFLGTQRAVEKILRGLPVPCVADTSGHPRWQWSTGTGLDVFDNQQVALRQ